MTATTIQGDEISYEWAISLFDILVFSRQASGKPEGCGIYAVNSWA
jgi:hypothetical protein